jgi:hypothetical protein
VEVRVLSWAPEFRNGATQVAPFFFSAARLLLLGC